MKKDEKRRKKDENREEKQNQWHFENVFTKKNRQKVAALFEAGATIEATSWKVKADRKKHRIVKTQVEKRKMHEFISICKERFVYALLCTKLNFQLDKWNHQHDHNKSFHIKIHPTLAHARRDKTKKNPQIQQNVVPQTIAHSFSFSLCVCCFIPFQPPGKTNRAHCGHDCLWYRTADKKSQMEPILLDIEWLIVAEMEISHTMAWMAVSQFELMKNNKKLT